MSQIKVTNIENSNFATAVEVMKQGGIAYREGWNGDFIFRQVPSLVPADIIPKMTSLPNKVKEITLCRNKDLRYRHQFARVSTTNDVEAYSPSVADVEAEDWVVEPAEPYVGWNKLQEKEATAGDTVGTATPLE